MNLLIWTRIGLFQKSFAQSWCGLRVNESMDKYVTMLHQRHIYIGKQTCQIDFFSWSNTSYTDNLPWYLCICLRLCESCTSLWYHVTTGSLVERIAAWRFTVLFSMAFTECGLTMNLGAASLRSKMWFISIRQPHFQRLTMLSTKLQMENSSLFHLGFIDDVCYRQTKSVNDIMVHT